MSNLLPVLVIFNFEHVLLPLHLENDISYPIQNMNGEILDDEDKVVKYYPEVPAIFEKLNKAGIKIAISDFFGNPYDVQEVIEMFGWQNYFTYMELRNPLISDEIKKIGKQFNTTNDEMILFHNDRDSIETVRKELDIFSVHVNNGMTMKLLNDALKEYESNHRENKKP